MTHSEVGGQPLPLLPVRALPWDLTRKPKTLDRPRFVESLGLKLTKRLRKPRKNEDLSLSLSLFLGPKTQSMRLRSQAADSSFKLTKLGTVSQYLLGFDLVRTFEISIENFKKKVMLTF